MFILSKKRAIKELEDRLEGQEKWYEDKCKRAKELNITDYEMTNDALYQRGIISGIEQAIRAIQGL